MTDAQAKRIAVLTAAAKAKSEAKTKSAERGIRALIKRGEPITFQAVQREAGVSHAFLYGHRDLRARIERLRDQARPRSTPAGESHSESTLVQALTAQIGMLQKRHRDEIQTMRAALEEAHGENLDLRRELARRGPHDRQPEPRRIDRNNVEPLTTSSAQN